VVVVTSAGDRAFSAGFDLREISGPSDEPPDVDLGYRMVDAIERMEAITIAAIHGHCVGGGILLAVGCDLRIAADNTRFSIPEVDLGIPLAWGGIPRLVREVGPAVTRELVMTCRPFDAVEAQSLGMVNRVVPRDRLRASRPTNWRRHWPPSRSRCCAPPSVRSTRPPRTWCPPNPGGPPRRTWRWPLPTRRHARCGVRLPGRARRTLMSFVQRFGRARAGATLLG
jgi:hypothetical protein